MAGLYGIKTDRHSAVFGLAGWFNGKTTLVEQVVSHLVGLGMMCPLSNMRIIILMQTSLAKIALDTGRRGAPSVGFISATPALFSEHASSDEPDLPQLLQLLAPADLVLVEGFKKYPIEKWKF